MFLRLKLKRSWSVFPAATPASLKCVSAQNRAPPRPHSESPWGLFCGLRIPPVSGKGGGDFECSALHPTTSWSSRVSGGTRAAFSLSLNLGSSI